MNTKLGSMIAMVVLVLSTAIFLGACGNTPTAPQETTTGAASPPQKPAAKEDAFIQEARKLSEKAPETASNETGLLPPAAANPDMIPVIQAEPAALDMGVIAREGLSTGEVKVHNVGKAPLEISQISQSCGCTKGSIDPKQKTVPPGGETIVTVTVDPKRIGSFESTKDIYISSNDPKTPRLTVKVTAKIDPEFSVDPKELNFGDVPKGTVAEKTVLFRQLSDDPIEILELKPMANKGMDIQLSFAKRPDAEWAAPNRPEYVITVRLPEDLSPGPLSGSFSIQSTCKRLPSYACTVKANITAFYNIGPSKQLILRSSVRPGQPNTASTTVSSDRPFEIQDLQVTGTGLTVSSKSGTAPNSQVIEVALEQDVEPGQRNETVTFTVKAGDQAYKERMPVRVYAAKPFRPIRPFGSVAPKSGPAAGAPQMKMPPVPAPAAPQPNPQPAPAAANPPQQVSK